MFRDTAAQETEHAFAHFRLLHPELVVNDPEQLSDEEKQAGHPEPLPGGGD